MSEASLPENWTRCVSKTFKQYYYFNNVTNESSWIHPLLKSGSRKVRVYFDFFYMHLPGTQSIKLDFY